MKLLVTDGLSDVSKKYAFRSMDHRLEQVAQADVVEGTCEWLALTKEYVDWNSQDPSAGGQLSLLLLEGKAGSGKSVLMRDIFRRAEQSKKGVCLGHFFDGSNGEALHVSSRGLYRSLLSQMLREVAPSMVVLELVEDWDTSEEECNNIVSLQARIEALAHHMKHSEPLHIYLDALNECDDGAAGDEACGSTGILKFIERLRKAAPSLKLCVSSRDRDDIGGRLMPTHTIRVDHKNRDDIKMYLETRLNPPGGPAYRAHLIRLLLKRSANMFQWVRIVVDRINRAGETEENILRLVNELPSKLGELYESMLGKLSPASHTEAMVLLRLIQVAMRPLKSKEVQSALKYAMGSKVAPPGESSGLFLQSFEDRIRNLCGGLAEFQLGETHDNDDNDDNDDDDASPAELVVQFTHQSVREFLNTHVWGEPNGRPLSSDPVSAITLAHVSVAGLCLRVAEDGDDEELFLPYAEQFWTAHARKGNEAIDGDFETFMTVAKCNTEGQEIFKRFVEAVNRSEGYYSNKADYPNTKLLREEENLLCLLAFEGCSLLVVRHVQSCPQVGACHQNAAVVEKAIFLAASRGWDQTVKVLLDSSSERELKLELNKVVPWPP